MARARIELVASLTHTYEGRKFRRGFPQVITNASEIQYYQGQSGFVVSILDAPPRVAAPPPPPKAPVTATEEQTVTAIDEDGDAVTEEDGDVEEQTVTAIDEDGDEDDDEDADDEDADDEDADDEDEEVLPAFSKDKLNQTRKPHLVDLAGLWGISLDGSEKKVKLVQLILKAQKAQGKGRKS